MIRWLIPLLAVAAGPLLHPASAEGDIVFRSDVALVRVDAQVLDKNRTITGLTAEDFLLREEGKLTEIRGFSKEEVPMDVLMLLDVSGSMQPHISRVNSAARQALRVLGPSDRVAVMVFDRQTRVRLPFRESRDDIEAAMHSVLRQESFAGGTDITRALMDAVTYISKNARPDARRAIVILTDDETERDRNEAAVLKALTRADTVLSALIAPGMQQFRRGPMQPGGWPGGGGGYPGAWPQRAPTGRGPWGGIGGMGGGGVILGPRRGPMGGRIPSGRGPVIVSGGGSGVRSAGTEEIARRSGGDSLRVEDASSLETTLARLRQRYALHFYLPAEARAGQERKVEVQLAQAARRKYPGAEVRFRSTYIPHDSAGATYAGPVTSTGGSDVSYEGEPGFHDWEPDEEGPPVLRRQPRTADVDVDLDIDDAEVDVEPQSRGGWRRANEADLSTGQGASSGESTTRDSEPQGGWRKAK